MSQRRLVHLEVPGRSTLRRKFTPNRILPLEGDGWEGAASLAEY
jgi:hypothetical protein